MVVLTSKIPEWKKKGIDSLAEKLRDSNTIGIVNIKGLPATQFHQLRSKLREKMDIVVVKKTIIRFAIEKIKNEKKGIEELENHIGDMPAMIFSELSPFQISKLFLENVAPAFAKPGQIAPENITIQEGPTPFAAGPMISELSSVGLKVKVDAGKIVIQQPLVVAKAGEPIKPNVAELLVKMGIQPMEVGLEFDSAWENNFVFKAEVLRFNFKEYLARLQQAANSAFNLSVGLVYPTKENISLLVSKAHSEVKTLALEMGIFVPELMSDLIAKAENQAGALGNFVNTKSGS